MTKPIEAGGTTPAIADTTAYRVLTASQIGKFTAGRVDEQMFNYNIPSNTEYNLGKGDVVSTEGAARDESGGTGGIKTTTYKDGDNFSYTHTDATLSYPEGYGFRTTTQVVEQADTTWSTLLTTFQDSPYSPQLVLMQKQVNGNVVEEHEKYNQGFMDKFLGKIADLAKISNK